jgi:hypothetical protein
MADMSLTWPARHSLLRRRATFQGRNDIQTHETRVSNQQRLIVMCDCVGSIMKHFERVASPLHKCHLSVVSMEGVIFFSLSQNFYSKNMYYNTGNRLFSLHTNMDGIENDMSNNYSTVVYAFVAAVTFLSMRCLETIGNTHIGTQTDGRNL